jgi:GT2 family glycosyltransferase
MNHCVTVIIPSLGAPSLEGCLEALKAQTMAPDNIVVVLSGGASPPAIGYGITLIAEAQRLGFSAAVNRGFQAVSTNTTFVALLNDDAEPSPQWLGTLVSALKDHDDFAAVQGTVIDAVDPCKVDGRGLAFDRLGLPIQVERGAEADDGDRDIEGRLGVSATAALFRSQALDAVRLKDGSLLDESFDCYHEDTDLALRMVRLGLRSAWAPGAPCLHLGSASGGQRTWRHPWWILANRWRALTGNLTPLAFALAFPRLICGEVRAIRTLTRNNARTIPVAALVLAALPFIKIRGWIRSTPGPRLERLPLGPQ